MRCVIRKNDRFAHTQSCFRQGLWTTNLKNIKVFASRRAAERFAAKNGIVDYELVPPPPRETAEACLQSTPADDLAFVRLIASILDAAVAEWTPDILIVIHIRNWFGQKWLRFSGKVVGARGVWEPELTLPPFHPHRVISQTASRLMNGEYRRFEAPPLHVLQTSSQNLRRKMLRQTRSGVFAWWTSHTAANRRGSLMVYSQIEDESSTWFLDLKKDGSWKVNTSLGIPDAVIKKCMEAGELLPRRDGPQVTTEG